MNVNLASLILSDEQLLALNATFTQLENQLVGLTALSKTEKKRSRPMGSKSEHFCRQSLAVMRQNPQMLPPNVALAAALAALQALDRLRPFLLRLDQLQQRAVDTQHALGSEVLRVALQGYAQLKLSGQSEGLELLRRELAVRFQRRSRARGMSA